MASWAGELGALGDAACVDQPGVAGPSQYLNNFMPRRGARSCQQKITNKFL